MPCAAQPPPRDLRRILVRGLNWLGDAVMSTPALQRLREAHPAAAITLFTPQKLADLWVHHPAIDSVISFGSGEGVVSAAARLRAQEFEVGLILPNSFRSALEVWWARIPCRIGYSGQLRRWLLTSPVAARSGAVRMRKRTRAEIRRLTDGAPGALAGTGHGLRSPVAPGSDAHHMHQYLHLAGQLGASCDPLPPRLFVHAREVDAFKRRITISGAQGRPWFGLNPGAEYGPAKRWPEENFIAAACQIQQQSRCCWLLFGGRQDRALTERVAAGIHRGSGEHAVNLAGETSLRELCAGLRACAVVLTNDTGPMHVAAAVGTRVVVPFGSTSPELTGPGLPGDPRHVLLRGQAPCAPCFRRVCPIDLRCLRGIQVADVVRAVLSAWQEAR